MKQYATLEQRRNKNNTQSTNIKLEVLFKIIYIFFNLFFFQRGDFNFYVPRSYIYWSLSMGFKSVTYDITHTYTIYGNGITISMLKVAMSVSSDYIGVLHTSERHL